MVAESAYAARDGADAVGVDDEPLPAIVDAVEAMKDGADQAVATPAVSSR